MIDTKNRNLAKGLTWKVIGFVVIFAITFIITGSIKEVGIISIGYHVIMLCVFVIHERMWNMIKWGKTKGLFIQMTGLSGAGKTTISKKLSSNLKKRGLLVEVIDGDEYREGLCSDLGFSKEDRNTNIRRLGFVGKVLARNNVIVIMSAINPYDNIRKELKNMGSKLVWVKADLDDVINRDPKGLYKKALLPKEHPERINNFTGISDPFEEPEDYELLLNTSTETISDSVNKLEKFILENI